MKKWLAPLVNALPQQTFRLGNFSGPQLAMAKAIQAADRESVLRLAKDTDLNSPGKEQLTLLFFAINESMYNDNPPKRLNIITELVRAGAEPSKHKRICKALLRR